MLVALVLMALLTGSLYASLRIAFRARTTAEEALRTAHVADYVLEPVRRDLECALPPVGILVGPFVGQDATGDAGQM